MSILALTKQNKIEFWIQFFVPTKQNNNNKNGHILNITLVFNGKMVIRGPTSVGGRKTRTLSDSERVGNQKVNDKETDIVSMRTKG